MKQHTHWMQVFDEGGIGRLEYSVNHITDQIFNLVQQVLKGDEGALRFTVGVPAEQAF